jgi:hypothetical protein
MLSEALIHRLQTVGYDSAAPLGSAAHTRVVCLANTAASAGIFPFDLGDVSNGRYMSECPGGHMALANRLDAGGGLPTNNTRTSAGGY